MLLPAEEIAAPQLDAIFGELESEASSLLRAQGAANGKIAMRRHFDARYRGQSFELEIGAGKDAARAFHDEHRRRYGYAAEEEGVELVSARLTATARLEKLPRDANVRRNGGPAASRSMWLNGEYTPAAVHDRGGLFDKTSIKGPALIEEHDSCTYVAPGWIARAEGSTLILESA